MRTSRSWISTFLTVIAFLGLAYAGEMKLNRHKIVLIGGPKSHGPAEHDYPHGIQLLKEFLKASPDVDEVEGLSVDAHPAGWPSAEDLRDASVLVLYFDGVDIHPLLDSERLGQMEKLVQKGVGLVALHQASTIPTDNRSIPLVAWLGGARFGMVDRTHEPALFNPALSGHPVGRGVHEFILNDEYYLTLEFAEGNGTITPLLVSSLRPHFVQGEMTVGEPRRRVVGWAFERSDGGRSFTFTGGHYLLSLDHPELRKLLLNAIFWAAGLEVPDHGVTTNAPINAARLAVSPQSRRPRVREAVVTRAEDNEVVELPWGQLVWHVSGELGNSDSMTTGMATIKPGHSNPRHYHPNCDEVLHLLQGRIRHTMNDRSVEMGAGDTVTIPRGVRHNATNIGTQDAVMAISFSSAWREVLEE